MSKARALEILKVMAEADNENVKDYNERNQWGGGSIERHLQFTSFRLTHLSGSLAAAIRELAEDEPSPRQGDDHAPVQK